MFNLKASNGETIATSERYTTKQGALHGIESVKTNAPGASTEDQTWFGIGSPIGKLPLPRRASRKAHQRTTVLRTLSAASRTSSPRLDRPVSDRVRDIDVAPAGAPRTTQPINFGAAELEPWRVRWSPAVLPEHI